MIKPSIAILLALYTANAFAGLGGNIGQYDDRKYGSLSDADYHGVVKLKLGQGRGNCTGVFVSKNLVLTNSHCAVYCTKGSCSAEFWNGYGYTKSNLKIVVYFPKYDVKGGNDWALLKSDIENIFYKPIAPRSTKGQILRGGFGVLRVIEDDAVPVLKNLYAQTQREFKAKCDKSAHGDIGASVQCINKHFNEKVKNMGIKPVLEDNDNFKVQTCNITGTHPQSTKMLATDCDGAGGDSGGPYLRGGQIVGLNNMGITNIFNDDESLGSGGLKTENFYERTQVYIKQHSVSPTNQNNTNHSHPTTSPTSNVTNNTNHSRPTTSPISNVTNNTNSGAVTTNTTTNTTNNNTNNTNNNPNVEPPDVIDDPQKIEQILEQRIMDFNCD